jgi:hypothetical protein
MARIDLKTSQIGSFGTGDLQLQNGLPMDGTLRLVTDAVNTASPLKLSTTLVQTTSTLKITTADNPYIDAEDNSGNNRFTVGRDPASQQVNVDFASNPTGSTTSVGAIRTYRDGTNLSEAMTFIEDGSVGIGTTAPVGILDLSKSAAATRLAIRGDAGQNRLISYRTGAVQRFGLYVNNTAESGANAGSDFAVRAYSDAGTLLDTPLFIKRSTGNVGIGTTAPASKLEISGAIRSSRIGAASQYVEIDGGDAAGGYITMNGAAKTLIIKNNSTSSSDVLFDQAVATRYTFAQAGTQILRIDSDGIKFGTDSAAANALDDYEEGTWTMGVAFGGASVGVTSSANTGTYTKIGRQVTVNGYIELTSKGSSVGSATITGLPFTIPNLNQNYSAVSLWFNAITFANQFIAIGAVNTTTISLQESSILGVNSPITDADFANNSGIIVNFTYFV